jgi:hypothetical protein
MTVQNASCESTAMLIGASGDCAIFSTEPPLIGAFAISPACVPQ